MHGINSFAAYIFCFCFINDEKNYNYYSHFWEEEEKKIVHKKQVYSNNVAVNVHCTYLSYGKFYFVTCILFFFFIYKNAFIILSQRHNFNFFLCPFALPLPHCTSSRCCCCYFFCAAMNKWVFCFFVNTILFTVRDFQKWPF